MITNPNDRAGLLWPADSGISLAPTEALTWNESDLLAEGILDISDTNWVVLQLLFTATAQSLTTNVVASIQLCPTYADDLQSYDTNSLNLPVTFLADGTAFYSPVWQNRGSLPIDCRGYSGLRIGGITNFAAAQTVSDVLVRWSKEN